MLLALPLPLAGEGWGGGANRATDAGVWREISPTRRALRARRPPPQAGEVRKKARGEGEGRNQSFKNSPALYSERNTRPACAKVSLAPSSRSTMVKTSAISPPASRTASTAVLDDHDALAPQALAFRQSLDREPGAVLLRLLAHEEGRDRMALDPGQLRDRAGQRHRAHLEAADIIEIVVFQRLESQLREQCCALGIQHGRLEIEVKIALAPRGQRDFATAERALADDLGEAGAGGGFGQGIAHGTLRAGAIYRRTPAHSRADMSRQQRGCARGDDPRKGRL
jgi:hypothetical protein